LLRRRSASACEKISRWLSRWRLRTLSANVINMGLTSPVDDDAQSNRDRRPTICCHFRAFDRVLTCAFSIANSKASSTWLCLVMVIYLWWRFSRFQNGAHPCGPLLCRTWPATRRRVAKPVAILGHHKSFLFFGKSQESRRKKCQDDGGNQEKWAFTKRNQRTTNRVVTGNFGINLVVFFIRERCGDFACSRNHET